MNTFELSASDGAAVHCYSWLPAGEVAATIQILHGMGEHAARYDGVAEALTARGYAVVANDHRGHGKTAASGELGFMGPDGWNRVLADAYELHRYLADTHPDLPRVFLGHSMGAMLLQQFITRHGAVADLVVLSGSPGFAAPASDWITLAAAFIEDKRLGPREPSTLLQKMLFGGANKPFDAPGCTGSEWLSRDAAEVQAYADDPLCGFVLTPRSLRDCFVGARRARDPLAVARIPKNLPIYVFAGGDDPVHNEERNLRRMVHAYRDAGLAVDYKIYPGGRHEMFNETNSAEVIDDVAAWLDAHLDRN